MDRRAALPVTDAALIQAERAKLTSRAALASIAMAVVLVGLKTWAAIQTCSTAMLG